MYQSIGLYIGSDTLQVFDYKGEFCLSRKYRRKPYIHYKNRPSIPPPPLSLSLSLSLFYIDI